MTIWQIATLAVSLYTGFAAMARTYHGDDATLAALTFAISTAAFFGLTF